MRISNLKDYELIDVSKGERLERFGEVILIRPDPQVIWNTPRDNKFWEQANAIYHRSNKGGGYWENKKTTPEIWTISYEDIKFNLKMMGFKHTGIFPEQATNWDFIKSKIKSSNRKLKILNLFAYTGGATLAASSAGAEVCHVDASKGMVAWAKENAALSNMSDRPIRWIVDDCIKFVKREQRRGNKYDGIIMDPPSYGRGPNGEVWKLEERLFSLIEDCEKLLSDNASFFILNSYTTGLSPSVMAYLLGEVIMKNRGGKISADEIGLKVTQTKLEFPSGSTAIWEC